MKEPERLKKPDQKDYFKYRGKYMIMDDGHATNFMDAQDDYIAQIESELNELKEKYEVWDRANDLLQQELQTLKDAVEDYRMERYKQRNYESSCRNKMFTLSK